MLFTVHNAPNVVLDEVKTDEGTGDAVLRLLEGNGEQANARITGTSPIVRARRGNTVLESLEELPVAADGSVTVSFTPFEVVILMLALAS